MPIVDLRSDTVTRPTPPMLQAMSTAPLGDDVLGDDPSVQRLQERTAQLLGKEAACFTPSGTMANQLAIRAATEPGDEIIAHADSHIVHYETGAPAALSGVSIYPLHGTLGQFTAQDVANAIRPANDHYPRSRMLVIENTHNRGGGAVWDQSRLDDVTSQGRRHGLHLHLDGARLWNAAIALGEPVDRLARPFDTVSVCFSKGLGAPVGSALVGDAKTIARARRFRKMLGGSMRQAGVLAGAALHALEHHRDRLADDHRRARRLAEGLAQVPGLSIPLPVPTNMVFVDVHERLGPAAAFCGRLRELGVLVLPTAPHRLRAVTHLDVDDDALERALTAFARAASDSDASR